MKDFRPGDIVGLRGWGEIRDLIVYGPITIHKRPDNTYDQHMWDFTRGIGGYVGKKSMG